MQLILDIDYRLCITWIIHQQICRYKVDEKLHLGVRERKKKLNTTVLSNGKLVLLPRSQTFQGVKLTRPSSSKIKDGVA
jgi:hypothetical protein